MEVKISVVIITLNEEKNIARCISSVEGVADEVIVVDSYSTDRTEEICRSLGARFITHVFRGHIEQKNWAINQARYPWILSLDADEALSPELKESIIGAKKNWQYDGYTFNRLTSYCGKWIRHTTWYPSKKLRLWDARKGSWGGVNPHDRFELAEGSRTGHLDGDLLHYSYYTIDEHIAQINKFSTIQAKAYRALHKKSTLLHILFHPFWRFFKDYLLRAGFLDGFYGFVVSFNSAHETFLKYAKLRNLYLEEQRNRQTAICFVNTLDSWGGGEKWHYDISSWMYSRGYRVSAIVRPGGALHERLVRSGVQVATFRLSNLSFINPFRLRALRRYFRREGVHTVVLSLSHDLKSAGLAARMAGVKRIIYSRQSARPIRNSMVNRYLFGHVITDLIANSEETRRTILQLNPGIYRNRPIRIIYNGVEQVKSNKQEVVYKRLPGEVILGNAGRLSEEKGQLRLIRLAALLKEKGLPFRLLIAGKGKMRRKLVQATRKLGVEKEVIFTGFLEDLEAFYRTIDIFLLSSDYEGFGYVMVEAMCYGKPVVSFDIGSTGEIIRDGVSGFAIPDFNIGLMAERVLELAADPVLMEKMGNAGRERVKNSFSLAETRRQIEELIRENESGSGVIDTEPVLRQAQQPGR
ncbi:MAG: glycosyltransferase [Bacteroidota bacterium]